MNKIAFICPTYPNRFTMAKSLLDSFYKFNLSEQADFYFVFTSESDADLFGEYPNKIILPSNRFKNDRSSIFEGIVVTKKFYGMSVLYKKYRYMICLDDDSVFVRNVDLFYLCTKFYADRILLGNQTDNSPIINDIIKQSCDVLNIDKRIQLISNLYLWFNQPCIYDSLYIEDFFQKINIENKLFDFKFCEFDFYMYAYYLMVFQGFFLADMCYKTNIPCSAIEAELIVPSDAIFPPQIINKIYQCRKETMNVFDNSNLFLNIHLDRHS